MGFPKEPLLFNIYFDLFDVLGETDSQNYTDDTNIHACDMILRNLMCFEHDALIAIEWFESNYSKFPLT